MNTQSGRSMVEMLGVLAIIGVLSVGAIAGYSKAMRKYKLNKLSEQINTVINAVARNAQSFNNLTSNTIVLPYLIKMGEIPSEMVKQGNNNNYVRDIFGNQLYVTYHPGNVDVTTSVPNVTILYYYLNLKGNLDLCQTMFNIIKEHSGDIYYAYLNGGNNNLKQYFGDSNCTSSVKCLRNMSLDDIAQTCSLPTTQEQSEMAILWPNK